MKKLILSAAIFLGSLSTFAQASTAAKTAETTQTSQTSQTSQTTQTVEEKYTEIKAEELPDAVKSSLKKAFPTAVLDKAFINEKKEYKLQVTVGEKVGALYADAAGKWITKQS